MFHLLRDRNAAVHETRVVAADYRISYTIVVKDSGSKFSITTSDDLQSSTYIVRPSDCFNVDCDRLLPAIHRGKWGRKNIATPPSKRVPLFWQLNLDNSARGLPGSNRRKALYYVGHLDDAIPESNLTSTASS